MANLRVCVYIFLSASGPCNRIINVCFVVFKAAG